jgi:hypothetical protein
VVASATFLESKSITTVSVTPNPDPCTFATVVGGPCFGDSVIAALPLTAPAGETATSRVSSKKAAPAAVHRKRPSARLMLRIDGDRAMAPSRALARTPPSAHR